MSPRKRIAILAGVFLVVWLIASGGYMILRVRSGFDAAAHTALTHLLGVAAADLDQPGAVLVWNTLVLTAGFALRVYAFATVVVLATKPHIDRRVRDVATQNFVRGAVSAGSVSPTEALQDRSLLN